MIGERMGHITVVPSVPPGTAAENAAVHGGDWVNLKNFNRASVVIRIGTAVTTRTVRLRQATNVAAAGAAALNFSHIWRTGFRLYFDPSTRNAIAYNVGEVVTGAGAGTGVIHSIHGDHLVCHTHNGTVFVASEVITGAGGATANLLAANFYVDEDILLRHEVTAGERAAAALNTFVCPAVSDKTYVIEVKAPDLNVTADYRCINADVSAVGAADDTARSIEYVLSGARFKQEPMNTAIYDW